MKKSKQFCKNNHNTYIFGCTKKGQCNECKRIQERNRMRRIRSLIPKKKSGRPKIQFCLKGHDTFVTGRNKYGSCKECLKKLNKEREEKNKGKKIITISKKQFCINGHNTFICGRYGRTRRCNQCIKLSSNQSKVLRKSGIVAWTDWNKILKIYDNRPKNQDVDHYIPLRNEKVFGLHVSWNLQYLLSQLNREKSNKCNLLEVSEWYGKLLEEAGLK